MRTAEFGLQVPVEVFTESEARRLLAELTGRPDEAGAAELAAEVGYLPLALAQAAPLIKEQGLNYEAYLELLRAEPVQEFLRAQASEYPLAVGEAIALALDHAIESDEARIARSLIGLIALLSETGVARSLLHASAEQGLLPGRPPTDRKAVNEALGRLARASLLTFSGNGQTVTGHRLTMRVVRERANQDNSLPRLGAAAVALLTGISQALPELWKGPDSARAARDAISQITSLHRHLADFPDQLDAPLVVSLLRLRTWAVERLVDLGDSAAEAIDRASLLADDCEQALGHDDPLTLTGLYNLARANVQAERPAEGIELYESVLADRERILGHAHPDTLLTRLGLNEAYYTSGLVDGSIPLHEAVLEDCKRSLTFRHPLTLSALNNVAILYEDDGRGSEALPLLEQVLTGRESVLGPDHIETLESRNNLAHAYQQADRLDEAIALFTRSLADHERVLGPEHLRSLGSRNNLARAYQAAHRLPEAIKMFRRSKADHERVFGASHRHSLQVAHNLAGAYTENGNLSQAIRLYTKVLAGRAKLLGDHHPDTLRTCANFGCAYLKAGEVAKAIPLLERALRDREQILKLGPTHPDIRKSRQDLADAYLAAERPEDARSLFMDHGSVGQDDEPDT
jgi:tetratricopeptide (TPR) repeat protein